MKKLITVVLLILVVVTGCTLVPGTHNDFKEPEALPDLLTSEHEEGLVPDGYIKVGIERVVDGDTLVITYKGKKDRVRLLDVDTPESVKPGVSVQPYAEEASDFTSKTVLKEEVRLVFEKDIRDRYGRLLAYVLLEDGTCLNALLVEKGYARVEVLYPNDELEDYFNRLQDKAVENRSGLWALPDDRQPFVKDADGGYMPRYRQQ